MLTSEQLSNIAEWRSEYPDLGFIFDAPEMVAAFCNIKPPREKGLANEWASLTATLDVNPQ
ncbi:MAG: hypothetical protein EB168_07285 [Euryarchaeota archaeon]|jgi:hypothetical protein|nr:hypothetical protein [Euryarchaeota archaeon]